jgi:hypothetical protein
MNQTEKKMHPMENGLWTKTSSTEVHHEQSQA